MTDQLSPTPRRSKRKAELLAASARLFQQYGYHNVSMDDIAAAVGITGPALYRHFSNKHEVLVQALNEQISSIEAITQRVLSEDVDGEERLDLFLRDVAKLVLGEHEVLLWKRERAHLHEDEEQAFRERVRTVRNQLEELIRSLRPGISDADARMLAWAALSVYSSTQEYRERMDRTAVAETLGRMTRAVVMSDPSAAPAGPKAIPAVYEFTPVGRRERVMEAAAELFFLHGYRAVSVEDIAEASQTAIATVYQLVSGKADLLHAVLARGSEGTSFLTWHRLAYATDAPSRLDAIVDTYIELGSGPHGRLFKILASDSIYLEEEAGHAMRRSQREYVEEWVRALLDVRPELSENEARARVHTTMGVVSETALVETVRKRPNVQGELHVLASAILNS
jgi:AcrR family transcriptional regulator